VTVRHEILHGHYARTTAPAEVTGAILFIHGLGESGLCFEHLLAREELACRRLLVPDLVGYGRTPRDGRPRSLEDHADDLVAWLDAVGEEKPIVLGHSMGGVIAVMMAERYPDRVETVIDVDGNTSPGDCVYSGRTASVSSEEFMATGQTAMLEDIYQGGLTDPALRTYYASIRLCDPATLHLNSGELVAQSARENLARRRADLAVPVTYIAGAPGGAAPRSRQLLDEAGVDVREISPSGHWPFIDQSEAFVDLITELMGTSPS